ncbi:hypothetical protein JCM1841_002878, partial [Sporobolomyces salmonicolor]
IDPTQNGSPLNGENLFDYNIEEEQAFIQVRLILLLSKPLTFRRLGFPKLTVTLCRRRQGLSAITLGMSSQDRASTLSPEPQPEEQEDSTMVDTMVDQDGAAHPPSNPDPTMDAQVDIILRESMEASGGLEGFRLPTLNEALCGYRIPRRAPTLPAPVASPEFIVRSPDYNRVLTPTLDLTEETPIPDSTASTVPASAKPQRPRQRRSNPQGREPSLSLDALLASTLTRLSNTPGGAQALHQAQAQYQQHRPRGKR